MLGHAFAKAGFTTTAAPAEEPIQVPEEITVPEWAVDIGWAIWKLCQLTQPKMDTRTILARLAPCLDGTNKGRDSWNGFICKRWESLTLRQQRESGAEKATDKLTTKGVPTWMDYAQSVLDALSSGAVEAHEKGLQAASQIVLPVRGEDEGWEAFKVRLETWAEDYTPAQLKKIAPEGNHYGEWSVGSWIASLKIAEAQAEQAKAKLQEEREAVERKRAFEALKDQALAAFAAGATSLPQGLYPFQVDDDPRFFPYGYGECEKRTQEEWAALPDVILFKHARSTNRAAKEIARRWGPVAWVRTNEVYAREHFFMVEIPDHDQRTVNTTPSSHGWFDVEKLKWRSSEVWNTMQRVRKARRTSGLDVSRVVSAYGRHAEKNFPRFLFAAWKNCLVVGVDNQLGAQLDDLKALQELGLLEREDCILNAHVRNSAGGGLYVGFGARSSEVLFSIEGGTSSQGRWGLAGSRRSASAESSALFAQVSGGSRGGGQQRDVIVAAVSEGCVLTEDGGVGYRFGGDTWLQKVPGLGAGNPGVPQAM